MAGRSGETELAGLSAPPVLRRPRTCSLPAIVPKPRARRTLARPVYAMARTRGFELRARFWARQESRGRAGKRGRYLAYARLPAQRPVPGCSFLARPALARLIAPVRVPGCPVLAPPVLLLAPPFVLAPQLPLLALRDPAAGTSTKPNRPPALPLGRGAGFRTPVSRRIAVSGGAEIAG